MIIDITSVFIPLFEAYLLYLWQTATPYRTSPRPQHLRLRHLPLLKLTTPSHQLLIQLHVQLR